jgi:hypothetical protein
MVIAPFSGRVMDLVAPWHGVMLSTILLLAFQTIQTGAGGINIAAVIVGCFGLDALRQVQNVSIVTLIFRYVLACLNTRTDSGLPYSIEMEAASRLNALFVLTVSKLTNSLSIASEGSSL